MIYDRTSPNSTIKASAAQSEPGSIGAWLFRYRTSAPLPIAVAVLTVRIGEAAPNIWLSAAGIALISAGELIRLWAVRHIGTISRTRSDRLGALVQTGPFAVVRNPLYIGNLALWSGFAILARLVWLAPIVLVLLGAQYHAITRWEERLLGSRLGDVYRTYAVRVPRWLPRLRWPDGGRASPSQVYSWGETLFSERGTLMAIVVGVLLVWLKIGR